MKQLKSSTTIDSKIRVHEKEADFSVQDSSSDSFRTSSHPHIFVHMIDRRLLLTVKNINITLLQNTATVNFFRGRKIILGAPTPCAILFQCKL